ncbi:MAG: hypothetical protein WED87_08860 [Dehalococcoidia bacterium]
MARSEARLQFGIWRAGLNGVSPHAKLLYCVLLTEPTLNHSGVGRACLPLWAENAGLTEEEAGKALRELTDGAWVLVDESTYEVFVRTLIRNDGVAVQPYMLKGALREALLTVSPRIRVALAGELRRLPPRQEDGTSKVGKKVTYPDPHATADVLDPPPAPKPTRKGSETLFDRAVDPSESQSKGKGEGEGEGEGGPSVGPNSSSVGARKRATRIPEDFAVTAEMVAWVREKFPHVDGRAETERFKDHFAAAAGQKGVKLDWPATWRNWMRTADERAPRTGSPRHLAPVQVQAFNTFEEYRTNAAGPEAARLLGIAYLPRAQPPSDPTPRDQWKRDRAVEWLDDHQADIAAAIERKTG